MPRSAEFDREGLAALLQKQHGVVALGQARACGMPYHLLKYRARAGGPWQTLVPGVYLVHGGAVSADQRDMAALLYAGPLSMITGFAAMRRHGIKSAPSTSAVDVLIPAAHRRQDSGFVRVHRTTRLPGRVCLDGEVRFALAPRAVADAARGLASLGDARAVVAGAVQEGRCPVPRLAEELAGGPIQGSARLRRVVAEVADGVRSTTEGELRDLIIGARLPMPMFNARLFAGKEFVAAPDCWWPDAGVAAEAESRAWHLSPRDWEHTLARHDRMSALGLIVLHFTPSQIRSQPQDVISAIHGTLAAGRLRPALNIRAVPA
ncbi:MAG TPA: hypothetical protein VGS19_17565 [Streptosporangiaceae bacterium]|nr:hypothetical protein [Streptosporangiaceae bacterium]